MTTCFYCGKTTEPTKEFVVEYKDYDIQAQYWDAKPIWRTFRTIMAHSQKCAEEQWGDIGSDLDWTLRMKNLEWRVRRKKELENTNVVAS